MIDINEIKTNYAAFDDAKIKRLAKKESKGLRDDVVPILLEEIKKRELDHNLIEWVKAERRILSGHELDVLKQKVKTSTCTICNLNKNLYGIKYSTIISFFIGYTTTHYEQIICTSCGSKQKQQSAIKTLFLGWWSPSGFFTTPFILIQKLIGLFRGQNLSDELIEAFIKNNIGTITLKNDSQEIIQQLLGRYNKIEHHNEI